MTTAVTTGSSSTPTPSMAPATLPDRISSQPRSPSSRK
jgi:hypothetical protein